MGNDTLIAIDATYHKWADILDLVRAGRMEDARKRLLIDHCPLCQLVWRCCPECPIVLEFNLRCRSQPCGRTRVFRMAFDGVDKGIDRALPISFIPKNAKTIKAIVRMLWLLDCLWERVRKRG